MTSRIVTTAKSPALNAGILILVAVYLGAVIWRGNVNDLMKAVWADFTGQGYKGPAFWNWAIALLILMWLAERPSTSHIFGPLLAIMTVALLIQLAINQPQVFNTLDNNLRYILGGGTAHRA